MDAGAGDSRREVWVKRTGRSFLAKAALVASLSVCICGVCIRSAVAQSPGGEDVRQKLDQRQLELRGTQDTMKASEGQGRALEAEMETLRKARAQLNTSLIDTTARTRVAEARVDALEARLQSSQASEAAIRRSLQQRRAVVGEVLAALQRMGRKPPPAIIASPGDMLEIVRTSMLLGAVVPELRAETQALAHDLTELERLGKSILAERQQLLHEVQGLTQERSQLALLVEARQKRLSETELALQSERVRAQDLARRATDLKDLIGRMESEIVAAQKAAEAAHAAEEAQRKADVAGRTQVAMAPFRDPARLAPAIPFAETRGLLPMPALGAIVRGFGSPNGAGGTEKGITIRVRPGSTVTSPADGWVMFSGTFGGYGQLLIINAGGGYYVLVAGMERINVELRQFVLAGEPVGMIGDGASKTATALAPGVSQPIIYVEFRKDGASIDPGPWWAKPEQEKVRG